MVKRIIAAIQRARQLVQRAEHSDVPHFLQHANGPFSSELAHRPDKHLFISRVVLRNHPLADDVEMHKFILSDDGQIEIAIKDGSKLKPSAAFLAKLARHDIMVDRTYHFPKPSKKKTRKLPKTVTQISLFLTKGKEDVGSVHYSPQTGRAVLMLNGKHAEELTRKLLG